MNVLIINKTCVATQAHVWPHKHMCGHTYFVSIHSYKAKMHIIVYAAH